MVLIIHKALITDRALFMEFEAPYLFAKTSFNQDTDKTFLMAHHAMIHVQGEAGCSITEVELYFTFTS
jgi:hypothetical protein